MHADALDPAATADTAVHPLWQQQLGLLLQSTGDGIFGIDRDGRCMFINRAGARLIGHAPAALLGRNMHEVTTMRMPTGAHYADPDDMLAAVRKAAAGGMWFGYQPGGIAEVVATRWCRTRARCPPPCRPIR